MRFAVIAAAVAFALAGCAPRPPAAPDLPPVAVSGPMFAAPTFDCGKRPVPPNPDTVGDKGGSAAATYENRLGTWGQVCQNRLESVGRELDAAGQVAKQ